MRNQLKTLLLLGVLSALLIGAGGALAPGALPVFVALAAVFNLGAYFWSDRLVLRMAHARPLGPDEAPRLHATLRELADRAGIPTPRLYLIDSEQANAFATGRNPAHGVVAVTTGLLRQLDDGAVRGVLAHELAHIKNRDVLIATLAAVVASALTTLANVVSFGALFGGRDDEDAPSPLATLALVLIAPLAATLVQLAISRAREFHADATGARIAGDADGLARALLALERGARARPSVVAPSTASLYIVNPLGALDQLGRWFATHPSTTARVAALRALGRELPGPRRGRDHLRVALGR